MKKTYLWLIPLVLVLLIGTVIIVQAINEKQWKDYDLYSFPYDEVGAAADKAEKEQLSDLPEAYLQKDTETLLANCLRYPLLGDYTAYSSKKMGMEIILRTCNGLEEFMKRSDKETAAFAININDIDFSGLSKFRKSIAEQFLQDLRLYLQGKLE